MNRYPHFLMTLTLLFTSCSTTNLPAIREFAAVSSGAAEYSALVNDYADSPIRQKNFQPPEMQEELDQLNSLRNAQRTDLIALQVLISEYMDALGRLAGDEVINFDREYDLVAFQLNKSPMFKDRDQDAYAKLANILTTAAADGWRRKKLSEIIGETNADFQIVLRALKEIVDKDFRASLENEQISIQKYYGGILASARANPPQQAGIIAVESLMKSRLSEIEDKLRAIDAYVIILERIAKGHEELYKNRLNLKDPTVRKDLERYSKELRKAYIAIKGM